MRLFVATTLKRRKGMTLLELVMVVAIILILVLIAMINYNVLLKRARTAEAYEYFSWTAYYLEMYKTDWGAYPVVVGGESFGKNTDSPVPKSTIAIELSGVGTTAPYKNIRLNKTLTGYNGGIEYAQAITIASFYNPFHITEDLFYVSNANGSDWVLYLNLSNGKVLYRTFAQANLVEADAPPTP
jgi:prepilin-type N-terminal cleavage/methylation domain-containing protein